MNPTPDRNKTHLTHAVTDTAYRYLADRGFKPLEKEVYVATGWIADIAGVNAPSPSQWQSLRLISRAPEYPDDCSIGSDRAHAIAYDEWNAAYRALPRLLSALVEVKTSVSDYHGDRKWTAEKPVNVCYVAMPHGLIPREEWPQGWGVILTSPDGLKVRRVYPPPIHPHTPEAQMWTVMRVANRMYNRFTYGHLSEVAKAERLREAQPVGT